MRLNRRNLFSGFLLSCAVASPAWAAVRVRFEADVPRTFQGESRLYLSGSDPALGSWAAQGLILEREGTRYVGETRLPTSAVEFKINLGGWERAETLASGKPRPNRRVACNVDCVISLDVENFALKAFHPVPRTIVPNVEYHHDVYSALFRNYRTVVVYLPPGYRSEPRRRYPVLYALDGNNLFDTATATYGEEWGLDETLNALIRQGELPPVIVVAIYNTIARPDEYLFCQGRIKKAGGQAEGYARFLLETVRPLVDSRYRTLTERENTMLLGSSFGGHFAHFAAWRFSSAFGRVAAMSTAYWFSDYCLEPFLDARPPVWPMKLWMDMGDREGWDDGATAFKNGVEDLRRAEAILRRQGMPSDALRAWVEPGAIHRERSWGARVGKVLKFLMGAE